MYPSHSITLARIDGYTQRAGALRISANNLNAVFIKSAATFTGYHSYRDLRNSLVLPTRPRRFRKPAQTVNALDLEDMDKRRLS